MTKKTIAGFDVVDEGGFREIWYLDEHIISLAAETSDEIVKSWVLGYSVGHDFGFAAGMLHVQNNARKVFGFPRQ